MAISTGKGLKRIRMSMLCPNRMWRAAQKAAQESFSGLATATRARWKDTPAIVKVKKTYFN
jgi:hypothetical protein